MTRKRREFSVAVQKAVFKRANGFCEADFCGLPFGGETPEYHHDEEEFFNTDDKPLTFDEALRICRVVHYRCHKILTKKAAPVMAKVRRIEKKAAGIKRKGRGFRGWTNMRGEPVWADKRR